MWGDLGESLDHSLYKKDDGHFIFIVTSTLIQSFQGKLYFSTTSANKFYVNLPIQKVSTLLENFSVNNSGVHSIESSSFKIMPIEKEMFLNRMSIKELLLIVSTGKQTAENNVYFCKKCNKVCKYPLIRFKVHVKVQDASGKTTFVIFNNAREKFIDTSTNKLFNRQAPGSNNFPSQLYNMYNKKLIFKLTLNKKNIDEGFEDFGVSKIFELDEKVEMERKVGGIEIGQGIWTKVQQMIGFALTSIKGLDMLEKYVLFKVTLFSLIQGGFTARSTTSAGRFHCWEYNIYGFSAICKLTSMYLICPCPFFRTISKLWCCWGSEAIFPTKVFYARVQSMMIMPIILRVVHNLCNLTAVADVQGEIPRKSTTVLLGKFIGW
ncbi:hypothetical protein ACFE04_023267 [Oxalis oulophora]